MTDSKLAVVQKNQIPEGWAEAKNGKKHELSVGT